MEDFGQEERQRLSKWIGRLAADNATLDDINGDEATDFCDHALNGPANYHQSQPLGPRLGSIRAWVRSRRRLIRC